MRELYYIIDFEAAALCVFAVTMFYSFTGKIYPDIINRLYKALLCVGFLASAFDIMAVISISYGDLTPYWLNYWLNYMYLALQNSLTCIWFLYIYHLIRKDRWKQWWEILLAVPAFIVFISFVITPFSDLVFSIDQNGCYRRGPGAIFLWLCSLLYLLLSFLFVLACRKCFAKNQARAIMFFVVCSAFAILVQTFYPEFLIEGFAGSMGCIILYISLQNPREKIDRNTGIFNRMTAVNILNDYLSQSRSFTMAVLALDGFRKVNASYGFEAGNELLGGIAKFLLSLAPGQACRLDGDNIALIFEPDVLDAQEAAEKIKKRLAKEWSIGEKSVFLSACICFIHCPQDAKSVSEIFDLVNNTIREAKERGEGTLVFASEHIENRERKIRELEEQKSLLEDMTREAEEARREAEQADRTKSIFLANMSHEIRTPMNAILGMTELILREETLPSQSGEYVAYIKRAGESLLDLINDILDISKIESGKLEIVNGRYYLSSVINDSINLICSRLTKKEVEFFVDIDHRLPDELIGDELRLRQILLNILGNAVKFTTKGYIRLKIQGTVENNQVSLLFQVEDTGFGIHEEDMEKLFDGFQRLDDMKTRQIEGTGLGLTICRQLLHLMGGTIKAESTYGKGTIFTVNLIQKIKSENYIIDVKNKEVVKVLVIMDEETSDTQMVSIMKNLGIGANFELESDAVWSMVEGTSYTHIFVSYPVYSKRRDKILHLRGDSKVIVITEFGQYLEYEDNLSVIQKPVYCMNVGEALNGDYQSPKKGQIWETFIAPEAKILLVDDNAVNLKVMEGLLLPYEVQITKALSGRECLKLLQSKQYHMVFLDHMMPEMDGVETLRRIRSHPEDYYRQLKVVALTANAIRGAREMFLENGFDDYISKPINLGRLDEMLRKYLPDNLIRKGKLKEAVPAEEFPYEIKGINTKQGILNCSGSKDMYWDLLSTVLMEGKVKLPLMKEYIATDNIKSYLVEAHALKSVASSIGAGFLSFLAKKHEEEAKAGNYSFIRNKGNELLEAYGELLAQVEETLKLRDKKSGTEGKLPLDEDIYLNSLKQIAASIEAYEDEQAIQMLKELLLYSLEEQACFNLEKALNALKALDYTEAQNIIKEQLFSC